MTTGSTNKGKKFPPEVLTDDEVLALMNACSRRAPTGARNRALIAFVYRSGLRISEALALRPKDLDVNAGTVRVLHGKGDKARTVGVDRGALAQVERWMDIRRDKLGLNGRHPLFCTLKGGSIAPSYIRAMLPRLAKRAGVEKRVHAHGFRHTHAAQLAEEGVPIHVVKRALGHGHLSTTARYIEHLRPNQVIDAQRGREWGAVTETKPAAKADVDAIAEAIAASGVDVRRLLAALGRA